MLIAVAVIDKVPVLPDNGRDWRETLEYVASIALANVTGAVLATLVHRMLPRTLDATGAPSAAAMTIAQIAGRHVGTQALRRRAQKIQDNFQTVATGAAALGAGASSLYTGIRALVGF
jgi:X-X-X-Leu-X-X-Gly heptad repeat protein